MKHIINNSEIYEYFRSLSKIELQKELENRIQRIIRLEAKIQYLRNVIEKMDQAE